MHGLNRQYHIQLENMMLKHWVLINQFIKKIVYDLLYSDLEVGEIANANTVSTSCVYEINQGKYCYDGKTHITTVFILVNSQLEKLIIRLNATLI